MSSRWAELVSYRHHNHAQGRGDQQKNLRYRTCSPPSSVPSCEPSRCFRGYRTNARPGAKCSCIRKGCPCSAAASSVQHWRCFDRGTLRYERQSSVSVSVSYVPGMPGARLAAGKWWLRGKQGTTYGSDTCRGNWRGIHTCICKMPVTSIQSMFLISESVRMCVVRVCGVCTHTDI